MNPFHQTDIDNNTFIRTFSQDVNDMELVWHRDRKDRMVESLCDSDWMFQMDNSEPFHIKKDNPIIISKETYHRIIKGSGDLQLKITEY
jgi:hypothetical protein